MGLTISLSSWYNSVAAGEVHVNYGYTSHKQIGTLPGDILYTHGVTPCPLTLKNITPADGFGWPLKIGFLNEWGNLMQDVQAFDEFGYMTFNIYPTTETLGAVMVVWFDSVSGGGSTGTMTLEIDARNQHIKSCGFSVDGNDYVVDGSNGYYLKRSIPKAPSGGEKGFSFYVNEVFPGYSQNVSIYFYLKGSNGTTWEGTKGINVGDSWNNAYDGNQDELFFIKPTTTKDDTKWTDWAFYWDTTVSDFKLTIDGVNKATSEDASPVTGNSAIGSTVKISNLVPNASARYSWPLVIKHSQSDTSGTKVYAGEIGEFTLSAETANTYISFSPKVQVIVQREATITSLTARCGTDDIGTASGSVMSVSAFVAQDSWVSIHDIQIADGFGTPLWVKYYDKRDVETTEWTQLAEGTTIQWQVSDDKRHAVYKASRNLVIFGGTGIQSFNLYSGGKLQGSYSHDEASEFNITVSHLIGHNIELRNIVFFDWCGYDIYAYRYNGSANIDSNHPIVFSDGDTVSITATSDFNRIRIDATQTPHTTVKVEAYNGCYLSVTGLRSTAYTVSPNNATSEYTLANGTEIGITITHSTTSHTAYYSGPYTFNFTKADGSTGPVEHSDTNVYRYTVDSDHAVCQVCATKLASSDFKLFVRNTSNTGLSSVTFETNGYQADDTKTVSYSVSRGYAKTLHLIEGRAIKITSFTRSTSSFVYEGNVNFTDASGNEQPSFKIPYTKDNLPSWEHSPNRAIAYPMLHYGKSLVVWAGDGIDSFQVHDANGNPYGASGNYTGHDDVSVSTGILAVGTKVYIRNVVAKQYYELGNTTAGAKWGAVLYDLSGNEIYTLDFTQTGAEIEVSTEYAKAVLYATEIPHNTVYFRCNVGTKYAGISVNGSATEIVQYADNYTDSFSCVLQRGDTLTLQTICRSAYNGLGYGYPAVLEFFDNARELSANVVSPAVSMKDTSEFPSIRFSMNSVYYPLLQSDKPLYIRLSLRPIDISKFYWTGTYTEDAAHIKRDEVFKTAMTANNWNYFLRNYNTSSQQYGSLKTIVDARGIPYASLPEEVRKGDRLKASYWNTVIQFMKNLKDRGASVFSVNAPEVKRGGTVYASYFHGNESIKNSLNNAIDDFREGK